MPSYAPGRVTPRTSSTVSITKGNVAVMYTTWTWREEALAKRSKNPKAKQDLGDHILQAAHLPRRLDSFPDAEEADDPHSQETQGQVPFQGPHVINPSGNGQNVAPVDDSQTHTGAVSLYFSLFRHVCVRVLPRTTHSQNSVTGEVKLVALAASHRLVFLRTVSSTQFSVFQSCLHLAQGSSGWKHCSR